MTKLMLQLIMMKMIVWDASPQPSNGHGSLSLGTCSLLPTAGPTDAPEEAVDHLDQTQHQLHPGSNQQRGEQSDVELHHVLRFYTPLPHFFVGKIASIAVLKRCSPRGCGVFNV